MPRVSDGYKDARRTQILEAAQRCFLRDGFHGTSMQSLFDESGLSSGAVYRYFPGKERLIVALAEYSMRGTVDIVRTARSNGANSIGEVMAEVFTNLQTRHAQDGFAQLVVLTWAESIHNDKLGTTLRTLFEELGAELRSIVRDHQQAGTTSVEVETSALATSLFDSLTGFLLRLAVSGPHTAAGAAGAARALFS